MAMVHKKCILLKQFYKIILLSKALLLNKIKPR